MRSITRVPGAVYFRTLLETLYSGLENRDVSGYAWATSDGWTQSRTPGIWTQHLECWIDLGGAITLDSSGYNHSGRVVFSLRYQADDDSMSQARMQAAIRDACEYLMGVRLPDGARVTSLSEASIEGIYEGGFVEVTIAYNLRLPR